MWTDLTVWTQKTESLLLSCTPLTPPSHHLCLSLVSGPRGCVWVCTAACTRFSGPEGIMWVTSQLRLQGTRERKQTGSSNHVCVAGQMEFCSVHTKAQRADWPDGEGESSSPVVTNWISEPRAAMELLGRMQRSPEKLLRSNAWKETRYNNRSQKFQGLVKQ